MGVITIPRSIRERLGDAASEDFASLINDIDIGARKDAIAIAEERFERRLGEESSKLQLEIEKVRLEIEKVRSELRVEIEKVRRDLSIEIEKVHSDLSIEISSSKADIIKWMFLFWIGQTAALIAIIKFMVIK